MFLFIHRCLVPRRNKAGEVVLVGEQWKADPKMWCDTKVPRKQPGMKDFLISSA